MRKGPRPRLPLLLAPQQTGPVAALQLLEVLSLDNCPGLPGTLIPADRYLNQSNLEGCTQKGLMDLGQAKTDIGCGYRPPCSIVRLRRRSLGLPLSKFLNSLLLAGRSRSSTRRLDLRCWRHHFRRKQE